MDPEDKILEQEEINPELKKALSDELFSYMNPHSTPVIPDQKKPSLTPKVEDTSSLKSAPLPTPDKIEILEKPKPIIRTFKGDMEETIQANHISSINIALAESKKMMDRMRSAEVEKVTIKKNYTVLIVSLILLIGGIAAFAIPYFLLNNQYKQEELTESVFSGVIIPSDSEEKINLDSVVSERFSSILSERIEQSNIKLGDIKNIIVTQGVGKEEKLIDSQKFISLIKLNLPKEIERTLRPEYMFGAHGSNGNQKFLILKIGSYENAFSGMLKWETELWSDFRTIFSLSSLDLPSRQADGLSGLEIAQFQDATYANKDSRIVKSGSGRIIFLYSIIDKNTIVITTSVETLKEIINRNLKTKVTAQ